MRTVHKDIRINAPRRLSLLAAFEQAIYSRVTPESRFVPYGQSPDQQDGHHRQSGGAQPREETLIFRPGVEGVEEGLGKAIESDESCHS